MPPWGPIKRVDLISALGRAGFSGPYAGGKHSVLVRRTLKVRIPNPHRGDIGKDLLARVLREAGITREEWEKL